MNLIKQSAGLRLTILKYVLLSCDPRENDVHVYEHLSSSKSYVLAVVRLNLTHNMCTVFDQFTTQTQAPRNQLALFHVVPT